MNDINTLNLNIDRRFNSYKSFFDHSWAKSILDQTKNTRFESSTFMLTVNMRCAANCHTLPWLMISSLTSFAEEFAKEHRLHPDFVNALSHRFRQHFDGKLSRTKLREVVDLTMEMANNLNKALQDKSPDFTPETLWNEYLDEAYYEWILAIWGSQRLVFGGLYFAFESFAKDVVGIELDDPGYKGFPFQNLVSDVKRLFGEDVGRECLEGDLMQVTQLVRHALAHNAGKESEKLRCFGEHGIDVIDGLIQIQSVDNQLLCKAIERRASRLVKAALARQKST